MSFLFIWQTLFQAPLSISSGALGFADYSIYLMKKTPGLTAWLAKDTDFTRWVVLNYDKVIAVLMIAIAVVLLYRRITAIGKISTVLWVIVLGTILWLIYGGATHFNASNLLSFPPGAWSFSWIFFAGLGHASVQTVYSYLGYYNVCNLGGEMKDPGKNIPRAIFISIFGIAILYFLMQTSILSVVPWQEAARSTFVVSLFVERTFGMSWATLATALILVLAFGSVFSATLGYSRVPYAAALDGNFFSVFAKVHPTKRFPHVALLGAGRDVDAGLLVFRSVRGDSRHPGHALPHPIRGPGRGVDVAAPALESRALAVPHVALSGAGAAGDCGMAGRFYFHGTQADAGLACGDGGGYSGVHGARANVAAVAL